jgi:SAM-dependent methyltransferase
MSAYNLEAMEEAERYNRFLLGLVLPLARGKRVLDFGAGSGTFARRLIAEGVDVTCVEPDAELLKDVHRDTAGLADQSFDLVYSFNVLEHIQDDRAALAELRRLLKPGGRLVLYVPAFMVLYSAMDRQVGHLRRYRRRPLKRVVEGAGFVVDGVRYADSLGFVAALAFRALGPSSGELKPGAVRLYDRCIFPLSRALDLAFGRVAGKNIVLYAHR